MLLREIDRALLMALRAGCARVMRWGARGPLWQGIAMSAAVLLAECDRMGVR